MVLKLGPVIIGIILVIGLEFIMSSNIIGLIVIGFLVGYMASDGEVIGLINSVIVGTVGSIAITLIHAFMNSYAHFQSFIIYELTSLTLMAALTLLLYQLAHYCIIMGIAGAIGGALNKGNKYH
jgi:uncharacterized membrane protein YeaQ/YmgE (transglycosylase-associated protein family)